MGIVTSAAALGDRINAAADALDKAAKPAAMKGALVLKRGAESTLNSAASGGRLRNVGKSGAKLSIAAKASGEGAVVSAVGRAFPILDNPTPTHWIGQGKSSKRPKKGSFGPARPGKKTGQILRIGGKDITGPVLHPGTKGKHTFKRGTEAVTPQALQAVRKGLLEPFEEIFK